jgi:2-dehydro-3-deoxygluconokinase
MVMPKIAIIGECMIELSEKHHSLSRSFGGDTLNTAVYLSRQTKSKLDVYYLTGLGVDGFSDEMLAAWQSESVNTSLTQRLENKLPGLYFIETDDSGERTFHYWRNDAAAKYWLLSDKADDVCRQLAGFDYIYLSGISIAILDDVSRTKLLNCLQQCRANGGKVIFDNNYRPRLWNSVDETQKAYRDILACTDIAFLTLDDEDMLWGNDSLEQVIDRTRGLGVSEIVIKRGSDACVVWTADGSDEVPAVKLPKEKVIDTTAAGDSFSAGYLAARLTGSDTVKSAQRGHLVASTVIQYRGAIIPTDAMPD